MGYSKIDMILLLGDWVPEQEQPSLEIDTHSELTLLNLEGAILGGSSDYAPVLKSGAHLYSTSLPCISDADAVCFSLANNHIKDFGWPGVKATLASLAKQRYHGVGVGENEDSARKPLILTVNRYRYAIFSLCEIQAGRATSVQPGTATIGPWIYQAIARIRPEVDTVIVSIHAGNEMIPWPSPLIQDLYRSYVDAGADIVHGHHSHVPQGVEVYRDGLICYGLGNFLASPTRYRRYEEQISLGVRIGHPSKPANFKLEIYRFHQINSRVVVKEEESDQSKMYLAAIQAPLTNRALLAAIWQEAALWLYDKYGRDNVAFPHTTEKRHFSGSKHYLRSYARRLKRRYALTSDAIRQNQMIWYNTFACLSHQHMMETALGLLCGELTDLRTPEAFELVSTFLSRILEP